MKFQQPGQGKEEFRYRNTRLPTLIQIFQSVDTPVGLSLYKKDSNVSVITVTEDFCSLRWQPHNQSPVVK